MSVRRAPYGSAALLAAVALTLAAPAAADWLVMRDGARVETRGAWEVRGALVVFTGKNGSLSSVRLANVDLDASQAATEAAARPAPTPAPAAPAKKKPVLVLTDADVGHADEDASPPPSSPPPSASATAAPAAAAAAAAPGPPSTAAAPGQPPQRIKVAEWHQDLDASQGGATLVGRIDNVSADLVQNIRVKAALYDDKGKLVANANALLGADVLQPRQGTNFRVTFPGVYHFLDVKFEVEGFAFKTAAPPSGP